MVNPPMIIFELDLLDIYGANAGGTSMHVAPLSTIHSAYIHEFGSMPEYMSVYGGALLLYAR